MGVQLPLSLVSVWIFHHYFDEKICMHLSKLYLVVFTYFIIIHLLGLTYQLHTTVHTWIEKLLQSALFAQNIYGLCLKWVKLNENKHLQSVYFLKIIKLSNFQALVLNIFHNCSA